MSYGVAHDKVKVSRQSRSFTHPIVHVRKRKGRMLKHDANAVAKTKLNTHAHTHTNRYGSSHLFAEVSQVARIQQITKFSLGVAFVRFKNLCKGRCTGFCKTCPR